MMFAPFWYAIAFLMIWFYVIAVASGLLLLIWGSWRRSAIPFVIGMILSVTGLGMAFLFVFGDQKSADGKARSLMTLPPEAQVVSAEYGDWSGDGTVVFKLPADRPVKIWFDRVWGMNKVGGPNAQATDEVKPQGIERIERIGEDQRSLEYDQNAQHYRYQVELGL